LGKKRSLKIYISLYALAYIAITALIIVSRNPKWLLGFISWPLAKSSVAIAKRYYDDIPRLIGANAKTVLTYQLTGLGLTAAALLF
jgi:1,4-dihydroxy-2-naphthoate octaprenyltransferase